MVSMKLMVDTAKAAHRVQFILITPQAMSGKVWGPEVRVTKMEYVPPSLVLATVLMSFIAMR